MQNGKPTRLLKIMTGSHRGAELALGEGRVVVGTGEDCDVVLTDALMAPRHFELSVKGARAEIRSLGGKLLVDQTEVGETPKELKNFQFITAGSTQLVLGPDGEAWPDLSLLEAGKSPPAPTGGEKAKQPPGAAPDPKAPMPRPVSKSSAPAPKPAPPPPSPRRKRQALILAIAGVVFLIGFLVAAPRFFPVPAPSSLGVEEQITGALASLNLVPELTINTHGNLRVVSGYVKTNAQLTALRAALAKLSFPVVCHVYSEEKLLSETDAILNSYQLPLKETSLGQGTIRIEGAVAKTEDWRTAKSLVEQDVAGLKQIDSKVVTPEQIVAAAKELVAAEGLQQAISLDQDGGTIWARGEITDALGERWRKIKAELTQKAAPSIQFRDEVVIRQAASPPPPPVAASAESERILNSDIAFIHLDGLRWVVTTDGKVYFSGALLPNGFTLERIEKGQVTFRRGEEVFNINPKETNGK